MKTAPAITLLIAGAALAGRLLCVLDSSPPGTPDHLIREFEPIGEWLMAALGQLMAVLGQLVPGA